MATLSTAAQAINTANSSLRTCKIFVCDFYLIWPEDIVLTSP